MCLTNLVAWYFVLWSVKEVGLKISLLADETRSSYDTVGRRMYIELMAVQHVLRCGLQTPDAPILRDEPELR
jgi:hypothetical protein